MTRLTRIVAYSLFAIGTAQAIVAFNSQLTPAYFLAALHFAAFTLVLKRHRYDS